MSDEPLLPLALRPWSVRMVTLRFLPRSFAVLSARTVRDFGESTPRPGQTLTPRNPWAGGSAAQSIDLQLLDRSRSVGDRLRASPQAQWFGYGQPWSA